ncbi:MAG: 50S ribosomal protein L7/L12 [Planctomycetota bacterium]
MSETAVYEGNVAKVIETLKEMTALELAELKTAIEDTFGVTAAAPMAMAAGPVAAAGEAEEAVEKDSFAVKLTGIGDQKIQVIKAVRSLLGLGLKEAKEFVDKSAGEPQLMKEAASKDEAEKMKKEIEDAGGSVELA